MRETKETSINKSHMIFCQNLHYYRKQKDLTQSRLSEMTGIHRTHISCLEQGVANPSLDTIVKLADALEVEPHELLKDHGLKHENVVEETRRRRRNLQKSS